MAIAAPEITPDLSEDEEAADPCEWRRHYDHEGCPEAADVHMILAPCGCRWGFCHPHCERVLSLIPQADIVHCGKCRATVVSWVLL